MKLPSLAAGFLVLAAHAQEPVYFPELAPAWWRPKGLLLLEAERIPTIGEDYGRQVPRERALLELDWACTWKFMTGDLAFRAAAGSDGNGLNLPRYDQRPSNGAWLHRASVRLETLGEKGFASLTLGLQGNPLLSQESLWDHDLGVLGAGVRAAFRREAQGLLEAGVRAIAGRVRTFPSADVDLLAAQAVVRLETGPLQWTAHAGRWELRWNPGEHRFEALPGMAPGVRQQMRFDAAGLGASSDGAWPWELKGFAHRNLATRETGGEFQVWFGPLNRTFRPRLGFVQQRFAATGTAPPVNGDEWWFTRAARGPRYLIVLPLPKGLRLTLSHLVHRWDGEATGDTRTGLTLAWRF